MSCGDSIIIGFFTRKVIARGSIRLGGSMGIESLLLCLVSDVMFAKVVPNPFGYESITFIRRRVVTPILLHVLEPFSIDLELSLGY